MRSIMRQQDITLLDNQSKHKHNKCIDRNVMCTVAKTSLNEGSDTHDCYQLWQSQAAFHPWKRGHYLSLIPLILDFDFSSLDAAESPGVQRRHAPFGRCSKPQRRSAPRVCFDRLGPPFAVIVIDNKSQVTLSAAEPSWRAKVTKMKLQLCFQEEVAGDPKMMG